MLLKNATVICDDFIPHRMDLRIERNRIAELAPQISGNGVDLTGLWILPGLVDIHVHGIAGADFCGAAPSALETMSCALAKHGVTAFCPASMTLPLDALEDAFAVCGEYRGKEGGAQILGVRMEGPFLSAKKKGAQDEAFLRLPSYSEFSRLNALCPVCVVDCAPELEGAFAFARQAEKVCTVSIAHTAADYDTAKSALASGFSHATHMYNAMESISARVPGVPTAFFESGTATAEMICDGFHVHPALIRQAQRMLGKNRFVAISDAMQAADMPDGTYDLGGQPATVSGGKAQFADGTIAGGTGNMFSNLQVLRDIGILLEEAVRACTINPARVVGADAEIGSIALGKRADLLITDEKLRRVYDVYLRGNKFCMGG
ncbi:MAG: N-acetylglucosamine-6-phosphate deacetylase [Oscillospiraceae bacterium]|jgi:N-acetylglucosamine-6-phosphate deacetylase|nr:N-acetylglucosamine-6-phosphate deacetylase [Oscillospiraceae bacterium]